MYIGLRLSAAQSKTLDFDTANTNHPHITLFYVDKDDEIPQQYFYDMLEKLRLTVHEYPRGYTINATVTGFGRFTGIKDVYNDEAGRSLPVEEPTDCVYYQVSGLDIFRAEMAEELDKYSVPYSKVHNDFKGHITHSYVPEGTTPKTNIVFPVTLKFDGIDVIYKHTTTHLPFER
jgi:hypothetical protein